MEVHKLTEERATSRIIITNVRGSGTTRHGRRAGGREEGWLVGLTAEIAIYLVLKFLFAPSLWWWIYYNSRHFIDPPNLSTRLYPKMTFIHLVLSCRQSATIHPLNDLEDKLCQFNLPARDRIYFMMRLINCLAITWPADGRTNGHNMNKRLLVWAVAESPSEGWRGGQATNIIRSS